MLFIFGGAIIGVVIWYVSGFFIPQFKFGTDHASLSIHFAVGGAAVGAIIWIIWLNIDLLLEDWFETRRRHREILNPPRLVYREQIAARVSAERRARGLLYQLPTPAEGRQLYTGGQITIAGPGCTYVLNQTGIRIKRHGIDVGGLCTFSPEEIPPSDLMIAQLLHLKFNQRAFTTSIARRTLPR